MVDRRALLASLGLAAMAGPLAAHPHHSLEEERAGHIEHEIVAFRARLREAIAARDVGRLRRFYAEGFTHTHGSGKVDGRDARIVSVLAGDPVIETAPAQEVAIRIPHPDTAIVTGRSPILNLQENRAHDVRWMAIYVRVGGDWQLAASQATRLPPTS